MDISLSDSSEKQKQELVQFATVALRFLHANDLELRVKGFLLGWVLYICHFHLNCKLISLKSNVSILLS